MNPFDKLKGIANSQKTVSTSKLIPIIAELGLSIAELNQKNNRQRKAIKNLNNKYMNEKKLADKRKAAIVDYENFKHNHMNLKKEYKILLEKYSELKEQNNDNR